MKKESRVSGCFRSNNDDSLRSFMLCNNFPPFITDCSRERNWVELKPSFAFNKANQNVELKSFQLKLRKHSDLVTRYWLLRFAAFSFLPSKPIEQSTSVSPVSIIKLQPETFCLFIFLRNYPVCRRRHISDPSYRYEFDSALSGLIIQTIVGDYSSFRL